MSVRDAAKLLEGESGLFTFIPPVGYSYLFLNSVSPIIFPDFVGGNYLFLVIASAVVSSFIYNYSIGNPDEPKKFIKRAFTLSLILHFILLSHISIEIFSLLSNNNSKVYAALILLGTLIHISLLITHRIIKRYSNGYDRAL
jgi:hypothetical protein